MYAPLNGSTDVQLKHSNIYARKSILKSLTTYAQEHYPTSSRGVYPTNSDSEIAILLVANKYSPNNFWFERPLLVLPTSFPPISLAPFNNQLTSHLPSKHPRHPNQSHLPHPQLTPPPPLTGPDAGAPSTPTPPPLARYAATSMSTCTTTKTATCGYKPQSP